MQVLPERDGVNEARDFHPAAQIPCELPDGSRIYVDLDAIAPVGHQHGPCLKGHFWLLVEEPTFRRSGQHTIMKRLTSRWTMVGIPENIQQLKDLLPSVRFIDGGYFRLGATLGTISSYGKNAVGNDALREWCESPNFHEMAEDAMARILKQDAANARPPDPSLSREELDGYPNEFWPYLVRMDSGYIGMAGVHLPPAMLPAYKKWERKNKKENTFIPDPRILDYDIWDQVPPELRPFLAWDDLFDRPGFREPDSTEYEKAMSRKCTKWWNGQMIPKAIEAMEAASSSVANPQEEPK
jgi:hypothetical protein